MEDAATRPFLGNAKFFRKVNMKNPPELTLDEWDIIESVLGQAYVDMNAKCDTSWDDFEQDEINLLNSALYKIWKVMSKVREEGI